MIYHVGRCCRGKQSKDTCISARAQRNNLFLLPRRRINKVGDKAINCARSNIGSYRVRWWLIAIPLCTMLRATYIPLLMMGNLLVSKPGGVNACANGSSRYPNRTALNRDTLASLSVPCTTRSLEDAPWLPGPPAPSRDRNRPGPPLRRNVLRLGI